MPGIDDDYIKRMTEAGREDEINAAENQAYGGLAFTSYGQYGGTLFDPMDGTFIEVNICDDCLRILSKRSLVLTGRSSRLVRVNGSIWGSQKVRTPLKLWDCDEHPEYEAVDFSLDQVMRHANDPDFSWNAGKHLQEWVDAARKDKDI